MKKFGVFAAILLSSFIFSFTSFASESLVGTWETSNGKTMWVLNSDGTGKLVRKTVNNNPGTQTTYIEWSANMSSCEFIYTINRAKLEGSAGYDYDKPVTDGKTYKIPFTVKGDMFVIGNLTYYKINVAPNNLILP